MKTRLLIIIGIIAIVSAGLFVILFQTQLTNSDETHLSSLLNDNSLCFDSFDEELVEICYSLDELGTYRCSIPILEHLAQYSNWLDSDFTGVFYIEWPSLPTNISEKDYDACVEFLKSVRLPLKQENESLQVTDSLTIPNAERDAKLAAGYKLYPGVGWVHPDNLGNQQPIYRDNPNNPGELILDLDAMIKKYDLDLKIPSEDVLVESDRITFQDKSLDYWKSLDFDQLREYNSKSDRDEFYYALGELLAKEYFLEKLVELNIINVNDDLVIHTGAALLPDPPIIGFNTVVNATDGFSYVMHTSIQGNRLGEYFDIAQLVFEPHILSAIAENKPAPFTNKFGESPTIYIVTEEGDDKLSLHDVIIDFDQTNTITFVNNSTNPVRIQEVGENKIDEIPKDSWRTKAIVPGESLTMQFNSTGFYEFNVKKITDFLPGYLEHHTEGEIVVFTENMTDYTFAEGLLMGSTFILDAPRPEIPWQSIGAGNSRGLEIGIVNSVIEAFPNAYEYYLTKAKSLIPFDVPIIIEFSGPISLQ